jgi:hypothetical protein
MAKYYAEGSLPSIPGGEGGGGFKGGGKGISYTPIQNETGFRQNDNYLPYRANQPPELGFTPLPGPEWDPFEDLPTVQYYAEGTSYNPIQSKTGFRSGDRDSSYNEAKVASNVFAPPATVPLLGGVPNYQADEGGESMGFADRPDAVNQNALNSVNSYNNDINSEENNPTGGMTQANISNPVSFPTDYYGNPIPQEVHGPKFDPMMFVPGGSFMSLNEPAIPTSGYGTPGTYSSLSGGKFNQSSQAVDPLTGQPIAEFGTKGAFLASLMDDPLSNTTSPQGLLSDMEYGAQTAPGVNPNTGDAMVSIAYGATDPTGNPATTGYTPGSGPLAAQQLGMQMGLPSHSVAPGTATNQAISTGQVTPGSQYSPTGTFTNAPTA